MMRHVPRRAPAFAIAALLACAGGPVTWNDTAPTTIWGAIALDSAGHVTPAETVDPTGGVGAYDDDRPPPVRIPGAANACPGSVVSTGSGAWRFASWWSVRPDDSAQLMAARASGATQWSEPIVVDSTDRLATGCSRPQPAIAGDSATGNFYIAYWASPPAGAGVFAVHWMQGMMHASVPVEFGDRPVHTSIAVSGHVVAIGYESPNGTRPQVTLAISHSDGHIFDARIPAAGEDLPASTPAIALRGERIALAYTEVSGSGGGLASVRRVVRTGRLQ